MSYSPSEFGVFPPDYIRDDGSVPMDANLDLGTNKIINVVDPTSDQDAATKKYVDDEIVAGGGYTDEQAQDAVGTILTDTATIDFVYTDATPSITADVKDDSVTFAKVQNIATAKLLGRATAATGDIEEITLGTNLSYTGTTLNAAGGGGLTEQDKIDLAWDKKFFSDLGVLPATERIAATLVTFPTEVGTFGSPTWTKNNGWGALAAGALGLVYWDLGALRSDILVVLGGKTNLGTFGVISIVLSSTAPASTDPDGFLFGSSATNVYQLNKRSGGSYTQIGSNVTNTATTDASIAFYYKDSTDTLTGFVRINDRWIQVITATDTSFTTFRYVSFRATNTHQLLLPFTAWSD